MPVQQLQHTQIYIEKCCEAKIERKKAKFCIVIELRCFIREWDIFFFCCFACLSMYSTWLWFFLLFHLLLNCLNWILSSLCIVVVIAQSFFFYLPLNTLYFAFYIKLKTICVCICSVCVYIFDFYVCFPLLFLSYRSI